MANRLTMAEIDEILTLHTTRHSNREIADLLAIDRETVGKYVAKATAQNQPNAPPGNEEEGAYRLESHSIQWSAERLRAVSGADSGEGRARSVGESGSVRTCRKNIWKAPPAITVCDGLSQD